MPVGGDKLPTGSLGARRSLKLKNGKERPYPFPNPVPISAGRLALAREEREALDLADKVGQIAPPTSIDNVIPLRPERVVKLGEATLVHTVGGTPAQVLQDWPDAPVKTSFVAVSMPMPAPVQGLTSEG